MLNPAKMGPLISKCEGNRKSKPLEAEGIDIYLSGAGMAHFGKFRDSPEERMVDAASLAPNNTRIRRVEGIYLGVMNVEQYVGDSNLATLLADVLTLTGVPSTRLEMASSTGAGASETAFYAVASGHTGNVLVLAGEKMTHLPTMKTTRWRQGFGGLSASGGLHRIIELQPMEDWNTDYAFIHRQNPWFHTRGIKRSDFKGSGGFLLRGYSSSFLFGNASPRLSILA